MSYSSVTMHAMSYKFPLTMHVVVHLVYWNAMNIPIGNYMRIMSFASLFRRVQYVTRHFSSNGRCCENRRRWSIDNAVIAKNLEHKRSNSTINWKWTSVVKFGHVAVHTAITTLNCVGALRICHSHFHRTSLSEELKRITFPHK